MLREYPHFHNTVKVTKEKKEGAAGTVEVRGLRD